MVDLDRLAIGAAGVATTQNGYRATGMSSSLCALNMTDVVVAMLLGDVVFGEVQRCRFPGADVVTDEQVVGSAPAPAHHL